MVRTLATHAPGPDGGRTSGGGVANFNFSRKHVNTGAHYDHFGRDFRVNDTGFFRSRANRDQTQAYIEVGQPDPWKKLRSVGRACLGALGARGGLPGRARWVA